MKLKPTRKSQMLQNKITYIYVLKCPKTSVVKYVGKTINPNSRLQKHLITRRHSKVALWIQGLQSQQLLPIFEIIDQVPAMGDWETSERTWIAHYRALGQAFCNQTDGGESGSQKGRSISEGHKKAISAANTKRPRPDLAAYNSRVKAKKVAQFDLRDKFIKIFPSTHAAARSINKSQRRIHAMCKSGLINGKVVNNVGGFKWKYVDDFNIKTNTGA